MKELKSVAPPLLLQWTLETDGSSIEIRTTPLGLIKLGESRVCLNDSTLSASFHLPHALLIHHISISNLQRSSESELDSNSSDSESDSPDTSNSSSRIPSRRLSSASSKRRASAVEDFISPTSPALTTATMEITLCDFTDGNHRVRKLAVILLITQIATLLPSPSTFSPSLFDAKGPCTDDTLFIHCDFLSEFNFTVDLKPVRIR